MSKASPENEVSPLSFWISICWRSSGEMKIFSLSSCDMFSSENINIFVAVTRSRICVASRFVLSCVAFRMPLERSERS